MHMDSTALNYLPCRSSCTWKRMLIESPDTVLGVQDTIVAKKEKKMQGSVPSWNLYSSGDWPEKKIE